MEWNGMEWNGIFSNKYVNTNMDCVKHCQDIQDKIYQIITYKRDLQTNIKDRLTPEITKTAKELEAKYEKLSDELKLCMADCERRNRDSSVSVKENVLPIDEDLRNELKKFDSDDDDDLNGGGNKRRPRVPRRRRSLQNRTHRQPRQTRRNQRRNTRRRNARRHRTRSDRK